MTTAATILNVDDDAALRATITEVLRAAGFSVIEAASGRDALATVVPEPDLVILDLHLPDMSGLDVCRAIKSRPATASTPVLMLSGVYTDDEDRSGGLDAGADAYLTKPVAGRELIATVRSLLRARHEQGDIARRARVMREAQDAFATALLTSTLDLGEVLERLGEIARSIIAVDVVAVRLVGADGSIWMQATAGELRSGAIAGAIGEGFAAAVVAQRRPIAIPDIAREAIVADLDAEAVVSALGIPLIVESETVGVLACWSRRRRDWSDTDIRDAETIARHASVAIRNARLYETSERRRRSAERLAYVGGLLSESLQLEAISQVIANSVLELLGSVSAVVYRATTGGSLVAVAIAGDIGERLGPALTLPNGVGVGGRALLTRQIVTTPDITTDPDVTLTPELLERARIAGFHAVAAVPLVAAGHAIGVMTVVDNRRRSFAAEELSLLQAFAHAAAVALENARLYADARESSERHESTAGALKRTVTLVELLKTVAVAANETEDVETAMAAALAAVCAHTGWPVGHLYLCDSDRGDLAPTGVWHLTEPDSFAAFRRVTDVTRLPRDACLPGAVVARTRATWIDDVTTEPHFLRAHAARASGLRSGFAFPVLVGSEVVGALEFFTTAIEPPDAGLVEVMHHIGAQLGRVVERARAREAMERAADELRSSEERYRTLVATIPGVAWAADAAGQALYVSPNASSVLGFTPEEIYRAGGRLWSERIHPEDLPRVREAYGALYRNAAGLDIEFRFERGDGARVWLRARAGLLSTAAGPAYACGACHDITERKQAALIRELLLNQVITVQEEERKRIARELHDDTAQSLASLRIGLERLAEARTLKTARAEARALHDVATHTLREVRRLSAGLRPRVLDDLGLEIALERHVAEFGAARNLTVDVEFAGDGPARLAPQLEIALYRIVQEALANVARHAGAKRARVTMTRAAHAVTLTVTDDGAGFDVDAALAAAGANGRFGLHNIRERAAVFGGTAEIRSAAGSGTTVLVEIPLGSGHA